MHERYWNHYNSEEYKKTNASTKREYQPRITQTTKKSFSRIGKAIGKALTIIGIAWGTTGAMSILQGCVYEDVDYHFPYNPNIDSTLAAHEERLNDHDTSIANLRADVQALQNLDRRILSIETQIKNLEEKEDQDNTEWIKALQEQRDYLGDVRSKIMVCLGRIAELERSKDEMDINYGLEIDNVKKLIKEITINQNLTKEETNNMLNAMDAQLNELFKRIDENTNEIDKLKEKILNLKEDVGNIKGKIKTLTNLVNEIDDDQYELHDKVYNIAQTMENIEGRIDEINNQDNFDLINDALKYLYERISILTQWYSSNSVQIRDIEGEIADIQKTAEALRTFMHDQWGQITEVINQENEHYHELRQRLKEHINEETRDITQIEIPTKTITTTREGDITIPMDIKSFIKPNARCKIQVQATGLEDLKSAYITCTNKDVHSATHFTLVKKDKTTRVLDETSVPMNNNGAFTYKLVLQGEKGPWTYNINVVNQNWMGMQNITVRVE